MIYEIITYKHLPKIVKVVAAVVVVVGSAWYIKNYDKIMETEKGKLQIQRELEEQREEDMRVLVNKGYFIMSRIPEMPPVVFETGAGWDTFSTQVDAQTPTSQETIKRAPRIERGKSDHFVADLLGISNVRLFSGKQNVKDGDTPHLRALASNNGTKPLLDARVDILFLDGKKNPLGRRSVNPLVVSGGIFGDKSKPLLPGESREFLVDATQPPSEWMDQLGSEVIYYQLTQ